MRGFPTLRSAMTPFPYSIGLDATLPEALALMAAHDIRHVPVTEAHALLGIVTERDISLLSGATSGGPSGRPLTVRDVYVADPYVVDLNEPLDNVLLTMAARHIGSALVTRKGRLAGVFTATDACRAFGRFLREHYPPAGGDAA